MGLVIPAVLFVSLALLSCQKSPKPGAAPPAGAPSQAPQQATPGGAPGAAPQPGPQQTAAQQPAPRQSSSPQPAPQQPAPQQADKMSGVTSGGITLQKDANPAAGPRPLARADMLMALDRERRTLPEDFKIGPLGDDKGSKPDVEAALETARAFLTGLVAGKIEKKYLSPDSEETLSDMLSYGLEQGYTPSSFRLGVAKSQENGEIAANVRLFGAESSSEGEIYMALDGKQWLVTDLQLSLAQLSVKREKSKEKFFPSAYRWLLEE